MSSSNVFADAIEQLHHELEGDHTGSGIIFARVTKVVAKKEHLLPGTQNAYSHFFGYAQAIDMTTTPVSIWFKKDGCQSNSKGIFLGPYHHVPEMRPPKAGPAGSIIVGKVVQTAKGPMFSWWISEAAPLLRLRGLLAHSTKMRRTSARLHSQLGSNDILYLMARLLIFGDVGVVVDQLRIPRLRERHPTSSHEKGQFQQKRGYEIGDPIEFAFLVAKLCDSRDVFNHFCIAARAVPVAELEGKSSRLFKSLKDCRRR